MSSVEIELIFEGEAVRSGTIDARLLSTSLLGYSEVFRRANEIANGDASEAAVLVKSDFASGSFTAGLQLEQHFLEQAKNLITSVEFLSAAGLATAIGFISKNKESLIELWKWLKGKKPDKSAQVGNNVEITLGQNKKTVTKVVNNFYGDAAIRTAFSQIVAPLRQPGIERISVKQDGSEQVSFEKEEAPYFEIEPLQLESERLPMEGERDAVLIVSKLSFTEGSTWTFIEQGATVVAKIEDEEFWAKVHEHMVTFGEGDRLRVHLRWEVVEKKSKLTPKNTITKVYELLRRPRQKRLDGRGDDEL
jgi:hypothetical protein